MKNLPIARLTRLLACGAALLAPLAAHAGLFRAYLSVSGNDANACTVVAPCRLLPAALAAVNDGGEIWMMDSANFNTAPVTIDKSVSILAVPGVIASMVASGGPALSISGAGIKVSLRNLLVVNFSAGTSGIVFSEGSLLTVDGCEIHGLPNDGIAASAFNSKVVVKNTVVRGNGGNGITVNESLKVQIENVHALGNGGSGIDLENSAHASVVDSMAAGNSFGIHVGADTNGSTTQAAIERSVLDNNSNAGIHLRSQATGTGVQVVSKRNTVVANGFAIDMNAVASSFVTLTLDRNTLAGSDLAIEAGGAGTLTAFTLGDNTIFNTGGLDGIALTPLTAQ
jgi:hypothetical protein